MLLIGIISDTFRCRSFLPKCPAMMPYAAYRDAKGHVLAGKRCPFASRKVSFYNANGHLLQYVGLQGITLLVSHHPYAVAHPSCRGARSARPANQYSVGIICIRHYPGAPTARPYTVGCQQVTCILMNEYPLTANRRDIISLRWMLSDCGHSSIII